MPQKLETVLKYVGDISNDINRQLVYENQLNLMNYHNIFKTQSKMVELLVDITSLF